MASHLSLTTVIFSLLRRYYIRVTEISRSMTSACCDSPRNRSLTIRWNRIERYLFNPFRQRSILLEPRFYVPFRSNDSCIEFHTHLDSRKKKKRKCKRIVIAHARERKVSYIESNFENLKFKIEDFGLWSFFFFLKMEKQRREYSKIILSNVSKILPNIITLSTKTFQVVFKNQVLFYH